MAPNITLQLLRYILSAMLFSVNFLSAQQLVTYAGNEGAESFNDVLQLSNGHFIVIGSADNLTWIQPGITQTILSNPGITNTSGTSKMPFLLEYDAGLQQLLQVYYLPVNAAEDFRFIKTTNIPGQVTGEIYISGNTTSGYFIGKLNGNFVNGTPTGFSWVENVNAASGEYPKIYQPWDVGSDGKVVYAFGDSHSYNWSAIYRLNADGSDDIVPHWRVHWKGAGGEYYGNAESYSGTDGLLYSAIVFKRDPNRCELRSTADDDYNLWQPDGNGGTKKGKWPLDVLYNAPCVPGGTGNSTSGPGYTGYSPSGIFTYGPSSIAIDRRDNSMYIGFNSKSVLPGGEPDFEPAVMAMDSNGDLSWWSRLYHEKREDGTLQVSTPDQYIDALAIDYSQPISSGNIVVGARCHGNNTENFWEGNTIAANPAASGFQNNFTGSAGNLHISWIGKLSLASGTLRHSTYMAECADQTSGLGTAHSDPNLDNWPDPNSGWPNVNTTYIKKNMIKVTADGSVVVLGTGRRTITTANAFQKMIKQDEGSSSWNEFIRVYAPDLSKPLYSSILTGVWDPATGSGGSNVQLYGICKTADGIVAVGMHTGSGNNMPVTETPAWGQNTYSAESAVIAHLTAENLVNPNDGYATLETAGFDALSKEVSLFPNPANNEVTVKLASGNLAEITIASAQGINIISQKASGNSAKLSIDHLASGLYIVRIDTRQGTISKKLVIQ